MLPKHITELDFDYYLDDIVVNEIQQSATEGEPIAQFLLGLCHFYGKEVEQDVILAKAWFLKAAEQGHYFACWELGTLSDNASDYWHWRIQCLTKYDFEDNWDNPYSAWGGILFSIPDIYYESYSVGLDRIWNSDDCSLLFDEFDYAVILPEDRVSLCTILLEEYTMRKDRLDEEEDEEDNDCLANIKSYIARLSSIV